MELVGTVLFMTRAFNFCAGPAALPDEVLLQAQAELLDWQQRGISVMEISHRHAAFETMAAEAEQDLRDLLQVPDDYAVLFMQGGATAQFSLIPMNLLGKEASPLVACVNTGIWSNKATAEAARYAKTHIVADAQGFQNTTIPPMTEWDIPAQASYLHYTPNETIGGLEFHFVPEVESIPLVADMSSTLLSRPIDVSKFALIYAGAQKNIGPAGITLVIVRKDLLDRVMPSTPSVFNYQRIADNGSMLNTPPTFAWYLSGLVFKWLKRQGGLTAMAEINERKATKLYRFIDESDFYHNPIDPDCRSWMNVPFTLKDDTLDARFLQEAEANKLMNLKGHRSVGGMRASIYNAVPEQAVDALITFMKDFEKRCG